MQKKSQGRKSHSKSQNRQAKILHKDTHVYNNCYEIRSRAIKNENNWTETTEIDFVKNRPKLQRILREHPTSKN